jgi:hypothetical protein
MLPNAELRAQTEMTASAASSTPAQRVLPRARSSGDVGSSSPRTARTATANGASSRKSPRVVNESERAQAQAPTFEMRPDGTSVVRLILSRSTEINVRPPSSKGSKAHPGRVEITLKEVNVGVKNNTNPLVTEHFPTPLRRVVLKRDGAGALLVLELREDVPIQRSTKAGPGGSTIVELLVPRPTRAYSVPATQHAERASSNKSNPPPRRVEGSTKASGSLDGPPGPRP